MPTPPVNVGLDPDTRDMVNSMLRISYYTDDAIARRTGVSVELVASIRNRRREVKAGRRLGAATKQLAT